MNDMISKTALLEFAHNHIGGMIDCNDIARFPTIEAKPVRHGVWRTFQVPKKWKGATLRCSECNTGTTWRWNYCPHCGAKMDKEENDR